MYCFKGQQRSCIHSFIHSITSWMPRLVKTHCKTQYRYIINSLFSSQICLYIVTVLETSSLISYSSFPALDALFSFWFTLEFPNLVPGAEKTVNIVQGMSASKLLHTFHPLPEILISLLIVWKWFVLLDSAQLKLPKKAFHQVCSERWWFLPVPRNPVCLPTAVFITLLLSVTFPPSSLD